MPEEGPIQRIYYGISDKAWSFAEWLEAKGLPVATFCDEHHINPILFFAVVFVGILLLLLLVMAATGGVSYGTLTVSVTSNGKFVEGATVYYDFAGAREDNVTNALGQAELKFPIGTELNVHASKKDYETGTTLKLMEDELDSAAITIDREVGSLRINVDVAGNRDLPTSSYVQISSPGEVSDTKAVVNNQAFFDDLPAGIEVLVFVNVGKQQIPSGGRSVTILKDETTDIEITIPESALTTSVQVNVRDSLGQDVSGAQVQLFNWDTSMSITDTQTSFAGSATFNDVILGTSIYATVYPSDGQYSSYNGKTSGQKLDITRDGLTYAVTLDVIGKVEVCVFDEFGYSLNSGDIRLMGTDGNSYATRTIDESCEEFVGLPEGVRIYPQVSASGYATSSNSATAQAVDYSTVTRFNVDLQPLGSGQEATVYVHVEDCDGNPINGMDVMIIDASTLNILEETTTKCGTASVTLDTCGNVEGLIPIGTSIYAVAYDNNYELGFSTVVTASYGTVLDLVVCDVDDVSTGNLNVCVYKNGNEFDDADVELYTSDGQMLWRASTDDDSGEDHCFTFKNIPAGLTVYAQAIGLGSSAEVSETVDILGGRTHNVTIFTGSPPVFLDNGNVEVCVKDIETNNSLVANVTLYDFITDQSIVGGETAGGGCRLFENIEAETNSGGQIVTREIYIVVEKEGYGDYNGEDEDDILEMVPNGNLEALVYLSEAYEICLQVRASNSSEPLKAKVVLYYNESMDSPIERKKNDADGIVKFYQARLDNYYFKVEEDLTLFDPLDSYEFEREDISEGECGIIELFDLGSLCDIGVSVLDSGDDLRTVAGQTAYIPFRILLDGDRGDSAISNEGSVDNKQTVLLDDGTSANVTISLASAFQSFALNYGLTDYSSDAELVASLEEDEEGLYTGIIEVSKSAQCSRQAVFDLEIYEEELNVQVDSVTFDPVEDKSVTFCIYVTDEDGEDVDDASVTVSLDEMDGWASTSSKTASYDEVKACYKGSLTSSVAPDEDGTYLFSVLVKRGDTTKIVESEAKITISELCGNGEVDSGEDCDYNENETSCDDDFVCNKDCECEEEDCGDSLSVTADAVTIEVGSGKSSGFCVYVSDDCGDVEDATVTAKFEGSDDWPSDSSVSASFDSSRDCYYVSVSESLAWPSSITTSSVSDYLGTRNIPIGASEGDRDGSGSTTATIKCGCGDETGLFGTDICEADCKCDEDCEDAFDGYIDILGCLQILGQSGITPSTNYNYPYSTGFPSSSYPTGSRYPSTGTRYPSTGFSSSQSGFTVGGSGGGFSLDLEKCKELLGMGDGSKDGSGVKGVVWVHDDADILGSSTKVDSAKCEMLVDHFKNSPDFEYVFVDSGKEKNYCCTDNLEKGLFSDACKKDKLENLWESGLKTDRATRIDIKVMNNPVDLSRYGLEQIIQVMQKAGSGGKAILVKEANGKKIYTENILFSTKVKKIGRETPKNALLWGSFKNVDFATASEVWFNSRLDSPQVETKYIPRISPTQRTIILSDQDKNKIQNLPAMGGAGLGGTFLTGAETVGLRPADSSDFLLLGGGTQLYVITKDSTLKSETKLISKVIKKARGNDIPGFEEVEADALLECEAGGMKKMTKDVVMLKANSNTYVVRVTSRGDVCQYGADKIDLDGPTTDDFDYLAYGLTKDDNNKHILVMGDPRPIDLVDFVTQFKANMPGNEESKIYVPSGDDWGVVRMKLHDEHVCTTSDINALWSKLASEDIKKDNLPTSANLKDKVLSCITLGDTTGAKSVEMEINFSAIEPVILTLPPRTKIKDSQIRISLYTASGNEYIYRLSENGKVTVDHTATTDYTRKFTLLNVPTNEGKIEIYADIAEWIDGKKVCAGTEEVDKLTVNPDPDLKDVFTFNAGKITMTKDSCYFETDQFYDYVIKGKIVDENGLPIYGVPVDLYDSAGALLTPRTVNTEEDGTFTLEKNMKAGETVKARAYLKFGRFTTLGTAVDGTDVFLKAPATPPVARGGRRRTITIRTPIPPPVTEDARGAPIEITLPIIKVKIYTSLMDCGDRPIGSVLLKIDPTSYFTYPSRIAANGEFELVGMFLKPYREHFKIKADNKFLSFECARGALGGFTTEGVGRTGIGIDDLIDPAYSTRGPDEVIAKQTYATYSGLKLRTEGAAAVTVAGCNNGRIDAGEQCEPPSTNANSYCLRDYPATPNCDASCQCVAVGAPVGLCDNGRIDAGEQCEPPSTNANSYCLRDHPAEPNCDATCMCVLGAIAETPKCQAQITVPDPTKVFEIVQGQQVRFEINGIQCYKSGVWMSDRTKNYDIELIDGRNNLPIVGSKKSQAQNIISAIIDLTGPQTQSLLLGQRQITPRISIDIDGDGVKDLGEELSPGSISGVDVNVVSTAGPPPAGHISFAPLTELSGVLPLKNTGCTIRLKEVHFSWFSLLATVEIDGGAGGTSTRDFQWRQKGEYPFTFNCKGQKYAFNVITKLFEMDRGYATFDISWTPV